MRDSEEGQKKARNATATALSSLEFVMRYGSANAEFIEA